MLLLFYIAFFLLLILFLDKCERNGGLICKSGVINPPISSTQKLKLMEMVKIYIYIILTPFECIDPSLEGQDYV